MGKNVILRAIKSQKLLLSSFKKKKKSAFSSFPPKLDKSQNVGSGRILFGHSYFFFFFLLCQLN